MSSDDSDYSPRPRPARRTSSLRRSQQPYTTSRPADSDGEVKVTRERRGCLTCRQVDILLRALSPYHAFLYYLSVCLGVSNIGLLFFALLVGRVRRKKCTNEWVGPEAPNEPCKGCTRLDIECLGWATKRPRWMKVCTIGATPPHSPHIVLYSHMIT